MAYNSSTWGNFYCQHCGNTTKYPLPIEPIYFMEDIWRWIPFPNYQALKQYMYKHKDKLSQPIYIQTRNERGQPYRKRVLRASDVRMLRELRTYDTRKIREGHYAKAND